MWFKQSIAAALLLASTQALDLSVSPEPGHAVNPYFYGLMFEDINYSGDGGLYAEAVENRDMAQGLKSWSAIGNAKLSIDNATALSTAVPRSLRVDFPANATGRVGFENAGFDGIWVLRQAYDGSFYAKSPVNVAFEADLRSKEQGTVLGKTSGAIVSGDWKQYNLSITPSNPRPGVNGSFALTFDAKAVAGKTLHFNLVSLFPPTFKGRKHGLRKDLAQAVDDIGAKFLRFPGGNNLEGNHGASQRWKWNETLGPWIDRVGRRGTWSYYNTNGLGLIEYLDWMEDMDLLPSLAVWSGLTLDGTVTPQSELQPYVDEAMNELEFLLGDASTKYGAQRIALGRPEPYDIRRVEIGNEDNLWNGTASYVAYRFKAFSDAILAKYPDMTIIASAPGFDIDVQSRGKGWADYHQYDRPDHMVGLFTTFDNATRSIPQIVGEYAVIQGNQVGNGGPGSGVDFRAPSIMWPNLIGAVAESIFMMGAERNADVVQGMCYAPGMNRIGRTQWIPDMISYTSDPADTTLSISYYVQQLFAQNIGTETRTVSGGGNSSAGPIYYSATADDSQVYLKLANYNGTSTDIHVKVPGAGDGPAELTVLSAPEALSHNLPKNEVSDLTTTDVSAKDGVFSFKLENLNVAVLVVDLADADTAGLTSKKMKKKVIRRRGPAVGRA